MTSLADLKAKWFLKLDGSDAAFPPPQRHAGSKISVATDGNLITPVSEGAGYMKLWHDLVSGLFRVPAAELYVSNWEMDAVLTLGAPDITSSTWGVLSAAAAAGVDIKLMLSRHGLGVASALNVATKDYLLLHGLKSPCLDNRFPTAGSCHQKFACIKHPTSPTVLLGSVDLNTGRFDSHDHLKAWEPRDQQITLPVVGWHRGHQTHDTAVQIQGPAVGDLELAFSERWNDSTRKLGLEPIPLPQPLITSPPSAPAPCGSHSVQVLTTFGTTSRYVGYSWSPRGEFSLWAAYLNAIKQAATYIYIEDQYFFPFGAPPVLVTEGTAREYDLVWQLGEALKRGVKLGVVLPSFSEDPWSPYQLHQRDLGVRYLIGADPGSGCAIASLEVDGSAAYVHSKLLIVDDEFVLIGSGNVNARSMTHDGELSIGIVDAEESFAGQLRASLWGEHLQRDPASLADPAVAFGFFRTDVLAGSGRVRIYPPATADTPPSGHQSFLRTLIDPYAGPDGAGFT